MSLSRQEVAYIHVNMMGLQMLPMTVHLALGVEMKECLKPALHCMLLVC